MILRKLPLCLLGAALAATILTTGCRDHHHHDRGDEAQPAAQPAAQPVQDETVIYNQWEADTHRAHKDLAQRTADEQREYRDWRQNHPNGH